VAIARYLAESGARPSAAVLAIAGRSRRESRSPTGVAVPPGESGAPFRIAKLRVVNDFEAIAWALTRLTADDANRLVAAADASRRAAVLGPGTGLGVAALVPVDGRWQVLASEGGHASFGPQTPDELEIFAALLPEHGSVSARPSCRGRGLPRLLRAVESTIASFNARSRGH